MAYTIYDFAQELKRLIIEEYEDKDEDKEVTKNFIDKTSERYINLQRLFGNNTEMIDRLYLQNRN